MRTIGGGTPRNAPKHSNLGPSTDKGNGQRPAVLRRDGERETSRRRKTWGGKEENGCQARLPMPKLEKFFSASGSAEKDVQRGDLRGLFGGGKIGKKRTQRTYCSGSGGNAYRILAFVLRVRKSWMHRGRSRGQLSGKGEAGTMAGRRSLPYWI